MLVSARPNMCEHESINANANKTRLRAKSIYASHINIHTYAASPCKAQEMKRTFRLTLASLGLRSLGAVWKIFPRPFILALQNEDIYAYTPWLYKQKNICI